MTNTVFPAYFEPEHFKQEDRATIRRKVNALLAAMTKEEKMNLCHGGVNPPDVGRIANAGYLPGIPRFGVPEIRMYDGPAGVTSVYETTGLPAQEAVGASWDSQTAYAFGKVEGSENFAISGNTQLGSQFDMVRTMHFMRGSDMLGEDPYLTSSLAVAETKGIQDAHTVATLKHFFAASIASKNPDPDEQQVDEQTLHELYFPPFKAAAMQADAGSIMATYNFINGSYASANEYALKDVLRDMWGYEGYVMSDWGANHSLSTGKGCDVEMPQGVYNSNERLELGIKKGRITWDDVDAAARHVLTGMGMVGYLSLVELDDSGLPFEEPGRTVPIRMKDRYAEFVANGGLDKNSEICRRIIEKGAVLLKNEKNTLPLNRTKKTAVIGLSGQYLFSGKTQERSYGRISRMLAPVDALRQLAPEMDFAGEAAIDIIGEPIPAECYYQDAACTVTGVKRTWGVAPDNVMPSIFGDLPKEDDDIGGMGFELKKNASADNDDDSDIAFVPPLWESSLVGDCRGHEEKTGKFCTVDEKIDFTCGTINGRVNQTYFNSPDGNAFSYGDAFTWDGYLSVPVSGEYTILLNAIGGAAMMQFSLDGEHMLQAASTEPREGAHWPWGNLVCTPEGMDIKTFNVTLESGKAYAYHLCVHAADPHKDLQVRLSWITPEKRMLDYQRALESAKASEQVVLFVSQSYDPTPLGATPDFMALYAVLPLGIPAKQLQLLKDVKAAMKPDASLTVVSISGLPFTMTEWADDADAILNAWMPGQEGGTAIAELLLGLVNPSGKLPLSIPARDQDTPITDTPEHTIARNNGYVENGKAVVKFSEGIFTGYRWHDKTGIKAMYPFGHGLSYTTFAYSNLKVDEKDGGFDVAVTVENTGAVTGSEIVQVYITKGTAPAHIQLAEKTLCGFQRLEDIAPGEKRSAEIHVPASCFLYWDPQKSLTVRPDGTKDKWVRAEGARDVLVGASSEDIRLTSRIYENP